MCMGVCTYNVVGCGRYAAGMYMSSKKPMVTGRDGEGGHEYQGGTCNELNMGGHRMPSSSEDLTFARITSDMNGLKTTMRKTTALVFSIQACFQYIRRDGPLYHRQPSP